MTKKKTPGFGSSARLIELLLIAIGLVTIVAADAPTSTANQKAPLIDPVHVNVGTAPEGRSFVVDGVSYNTTQYFTWERGSFHSVSTTSPQDTDSSHYLWNSWSDGGLQSHEFIAEDPTVLVAHFTTQYYLSISGGTPSSGFRDAGLSVDILASPCTIPFHNFWGWFGFGNGSYTGSSRAATVYMLGPIQEAAICEGPPPTMTPTPPPTPSPTPTPLAFQVNSFDDTQDAVPGDSICADLAGMCSLRAAISEGNHQTFGATVTLPAGVFTQGLTGEPEDQNVAGDWDVTGRITITGAGSSATIIQAATEPGIASDRVIHGLGGSSTTIRGVTIRNGRKLFTGSPDLGGGGIGLEGASPRLELDDVVVANNISQSDGGGIAVLADRARFKIANSTIRDNRAGSDVPGSSAAGGGMDFSGTDESFFNDFEVTDTVIRNNIVNSSVASAYGGGLRSNIDGIDVDCDFCDISENEAISTAGEGYIGSGGGLFDSGGRVILYSSTVTSNVASHSGGGVAAAGSGASVFLWRTTISGNTAPDGGGIDTINLGLNIDKSTISGNTASGHGAGIRLQRTGPNAFDMFLSASTVSGNTAALGAGIYNDGATVNMRTTTIAANIATERGGGLLNSDSAGGFIRPTGSIVADNQAPMGPDVSGVITSAKYNHIEDVSGSTFIPALGDTTGTDPQLSPLSNNGGSTLTHIPAADSVVVDMVAPLNVDCYHSYSDQRGLPRWSGPQCDKGSVELYVTPTPTPTVNVTVTTNPAGRLFKVDGVTYSEPQTFAWNVGSSHTLASFLVQDGTEPTRYAWSSWSDGGAITHGVTASADAAYIANHTTQHRVLTCCGDASIGNTVAPSTAYYNAGEAITIGATAGNGFTFSQWLGRGQGSYTGPLNSVSILVNGPIEQYALLERRMPRSRFDYDGDGRSDVSVFRPAEGNWYLQRSTDGFTATNFGLRSDKIVPADFDGDGKTDIAVYRPQQGIWYIARSSDGTLEAAQFGIAEDIPAVGDFDGDERADLSVFRPSTGAWYIANTSDGSYTSRNWGQSGDVPVARDYDGDARADIAVFRPGDGKWYILRSGSGTFQIEAFGLVIDKPVAGDFGGDGKADIAVYRPSEGRWYIHDSFDGSYIAVNFGTAEDIPASGDFDGDGRTDIAVFRPSTGHWYITNSSNGSFTIMQFGLADDIPTQSADNNFGR
jgi:CSLREA domain-containing protein